MPDVLFDLVSSFHIPLIEHLENHRLIILYVADIHILEDGKRLAKFERAKRPVYMQVRKHYEEDKKYCPGRIKESWLKQEDQERYFWIRVEIDEALDDSGYFYNDK